MKELKELEKELGDLLSQYCDSKKVEERADNWVDEHEFYGILNECEELIKRINGVQ